MTTTHHLAAMMFADIAGYTELMQHDESKALLLLNRFKDILEKTSLAHDGKIIQYFGDGCLLSFDSSVNSLECAISMQSEFRKNTKIPVRIGIHLGEVLFKNENAFGDGVNIASRIETLGIPGAILFSKQIRDQVKNKSAFKLVSLGHFDFKNVDEQIEVFALANDGLIIPRPEELSGKLKLPAAKNKNTTIRKVLLVLSALLLLFAAYFLIPLTPKEAATTKNSNRTAIAVLYFTNLSGDSTQDYFSDGITEEIRSHLSMINGLRVISRTSVLQYKNKPKNIQQIAKEIGADHILEGSVRKQGNNVRITTQLINGKTDEQIWGINYDGELKDIFAVQSDIATQIADKLRITLPPGTRKRLGSNITINIEAYDKYLKASSLRYMESGLGGKRLNIQKAISLLREVIKLDSNFVDAFSLLSQCFSINSRVAENPKNLLDSALFYADKAIKINPDNSSGYLAKAIANEQLGRTDETLKWLLKSHELLPYSTASNIAFQYLNKNEYAKAYEWVMKAKEYDPNGVENYIEPEGEIYFNLGLLDSMKNCIYTARKFQPESQNIDFIAILYYQITGNEEGYKTIYKKRMALDEKMLAYDIGQFYLWQRNWKVADSFYNISARPDEMDAGLIKIQLGKEELGKKYLTNAIKNRLSFIGLNDAWHNYDISRCYAAMRNDRYLEYLEKAFEKGWHVYSWFQTDPFYEFVRESPGFKKINGKVYERNEKLKAELLESMIKYNKKRKN